MRWLVVSCVLFLGAVQASYCDPLQVKTTKGAVRGQILKSRSGRDYYSFTGIPYAKPPVDDLRFQPPVPVDSWKGTLDATKPSSICIQNNHFFPVLKDIIDGVEDCLYLNVFTPNVDQKLPVLFWIHGGGFLAGHSNPSLYGPEYFLDKDVVVVSFNYRLNVFGFVSTEDDVIPGNNGMKDQVAALRWVQDNIAKFGGDPERVTIFGESAGSASTGYHLLSPLSKGLFHKAIMQSGSPLCRWAVAAPGLIRKRTEAVATIAGCHFENSKDILNCLKKLPARYLVELHNRFFEFLNHPSVIFPPVVESCDSNPDAFLCNHPFTDFKQESKVPTMLGFNTGEGGVFASNLFNGTALKYPELDTEFNRIVASILMYKHLSLPEDVNDIGDKIRKKYFPSGKLDDPLKAVDMIGEGTFLTGVLDMTLKLSPPARLYVFGYENQFSFNTLYGDYKGSLGVTHGDEMISLFSLKDVVHDPLNKKEIEVSQLMVNIWVKFASSKTPTIDGTDDGPAWPEFTSIKSKLLQINSARPSIVKNPYEEKYKFWSGLPTTSSLEKTSNIKTEL